MTCSFFIVGAYLPLVWNIEPNIVKIVFGRESIMEKQPENGFNFIRGCGSPHKFKFIGLGKFLPKFYSNYTCY